MVSSFRNYKLLLDQIVNNLKTSQYYSLDTWVAENRVLSSKNAEAGKFNFDRTPYLREIMYNLSPQSLYSKIVVMKAPQLGMTELAISWMFYVIAANPASMYYITTTNDEANKFVRTRFNPESRVHSELKAKFKEMDSVRTGDNLQVKSFIGGYIHFTSGNTATPFRSRSVKNIIVDEADKLPPNIAGEGDPIQLLENRQKTYYDSKMLIISTPTIDEEMPSNYADEVSKSIIYREYMLGDQRKYFVPCPLCGEFQTLEFEHLVHEIVENTVALHGYLCQFCFCIFEEKYKTEMLLRGEWRPTADPQDKRTASYHINGLYSPTLWQNWDYHVRLHYQSLRDRLKRINFCNNTLGMPFNESSLGVEAEQLLARREKYNTSYIAQYPNKKEPKYNLPEGLLFLTAGVDVHKSRLECSVWGWGLGMESWLIDHRVIVANNSANISDTCWLSLDSYLKNIWVLHSGTRVALESVLIDVGYNSETVNMFCRGVNYAYIPVKGTTTGVVAVKQMTTQGVGRIDANTNLLKTMFFAQLEDIGMGDRGYVHLPKNIDTIEYYRQLVAEKRTYENGKEIWRKSRPRNEALDCAIYARAGAILFGLPEWSEEHAQQYLNNIN